MRKNPKIEKDNYLPLYKKGKTDVEISKILKIPYRTVSSFRKNNLKLPLVQDNITITKKQEEILIGTLLGDSTISYVHKNCRFPNLTFCHSDKQEMYFNIKCEKLSCLISSKIKRDYYKNKKVFGRLSNNNPVNYAIGKNLKVLEKYRKIFYPRGLKIIPVDFLKNNFTNQSLSYLFMDDGNKNGKTINLNLHCFETKDLEEFVDFLQQDFNLFFNIKKDKTLYLRQKSVETFKKIVLPYITEDCLYKIP